MYRPVKRRRCPLELRRTTSREKLPPVAQRECWDEHVIVAALESVDAHQDLTIIRPTYIGHSMNGYEYTLRTSTKHSKRAGYVAKEAGCKLFDLIPFNRLPCINKACLHAFM